MEGEQIGRLLRQAAEHAIRYRSELPSRPQRPLHGYTDALAALTTPCLRPEMRPTS